MTCEDEGGGTSLVLLSSRVGDNVGERGGQGSNDDDCGRGGRVIVIVVVKGGGGGGGWVYFRLWGCLGRRNGERSRNRERGRAQALGGRRFLNSYNDQPKDGVRGRGDIRDGM